MAGVSGFSAGPLATTGGLGTRVGVAFVSLTTDNSGLMQGFREADVMAQRWAQRFGTTAGAALARTGRQLSSVGSSMTRSLTLPLVAAGGAAVAYAARFSTAMTRTVALAGVAQKNLSKVTEEVKNLAIATGQDPVAVADTLYTVASAGLKAAQVMPTLKAAAEGAMTQLGDVGVVGRTLITILNSYADTGIHVSQVMDVMTEAVKLGAAESDELASSVGTVVPLAAQMNIGFDQVAGAIAAVTNNGVETNRAVTGLRYILTSLLRPTDKAKDTLADYNLTVAEVQKNLADPSVGLLGTLKLLSDTFDLSTVKGREAWNDVLGAIRGTIVANPLVGQSFEKNRDIIEQVGEAMTNTGSEFGKAAEIMRETPAVQFAQNWTKMKVAAIEAGAAILPVATKIVEIVGNLAQAFAELPEPLQHTVLWIGALTAAAGPALYVLGKLLSAAAFVQGSIGGGIAAVRGTSVAGGLAAGGGLGGVATQAGAAAAFTPMGGGTRYGAFGQPYVSPFAGGAATAGGFRGGLNRFFQGSSLARGALIAADVILVGEAIKKVAGEFQRVENATSDWADQLNRGKISADELYTAIKQNTGGFTGLVDTEVLTAGADALQEWLDKVQDISDNTLRADGAQKQWNDTVTRSGHLTDAQRRQLGLMLDTITSLNIRMSPLNQSILDAAVEGGRWKDVLNVIQDTIDGKLAPAVRGATDLLDKEARKHALVAIKAGDELSVLEDLAQMRGRQYADQKSLLDLQRSLAREAGLPLQVQNYQRVQARYPGNYQEVPTGEPIPTDVAKVFNAIRTSPFIPRQAQVELSGLVTQFYKAGGTINGARLAQIQFNLAMGKYLGLQRLTSRWLKDNVNLTEEWKQRNEDLADSLLTGPLKTLMDTHRPELLTAPIGPRNMAQIFNRLSILGEQIPDIFEGKSGQRREIKFFALLDDGKAKRALTLLKTWIMENNPFFLAVDLNLAPALASWDAFMRQLRADENISISPGGRPRNQGRGPRGGGGGHHGGGGGGGGGGTWIPSPGGGYYGHSGGWIGGGVYARMHSGGFIDDIPLIAQRGEFMVNRHDAAREAAMLQYINRGGKTNRLGSEEVLEAVRSMHMMQAAQMEQIKRVLAQAGMNRGHGDIYLDGHKVGRVLDDRKARRARGA